MSKIFYDHLIIIDSVTEVLDRQSLTIEERKEVLNSVDETLHHHVLDVILTNLPSEHHQKFLSHFHQAPQDRRLLAFLKEKTVIDIEKEILKEVKKVQKEVIALIEKSAK